jgi:hypothetical protein
MPDDTLIQEFNTLRLDAEEYRITVTSPAVGLYRVNIFAQGDASISEIAERQQRLVAHTAMWKDVEKAKEEAVAIFSALRFEGFEPVSELPQGFVGRDDEILMKALFKRPAEIAQRFTSDTITLGVSATSTIYSLFVVSVGTTGFRLRSFVGEIASETSERTGKFRLPQFRMNRGMGYTDLKSAVSRYEIFQNEYLREGWARCNSVDASKFIDLANSVDLSTPLRRTASYTDLPTTTAGTVIPW